MEQKRIQVEDWLKNNRNELPPEIEEIDAIDLDIAAGVGVLLSAEEEPIRRRIRGLGSMESDMIN